MKNKYKCNHCGKVVIRYSDKMWMQSFCTKTDKDVRIYKIKKVKTCHTL